MKKRSLILIVSLLLMSSFVLPSFVSAQTPSPGNGSSPNTNGQVPAPTVMFSNSPRGSGDLINLAVGVSQGQVCGTTWSAHKTNLPFMSNNQQKGTVLSEGFQGEIGTTVANFSSDLEINLGDQEAPVGAPNLNLPAMFINTPYGSIPVSFCNASSFNVQVGNVTYINGLPTVENTITFNSVALPTYGQGASSITFVIAQTVIANWTNMIIKIGVYADLSNMKLYLSDGTEIPQNTDFSFNLMYQIDMNNADTTPGAIIDYPPSNITPTSVFFSVNGTSGTQISIANMNLGDTYTEFQGSNQYAGKTPTIYFSQSTAPSWAVNCFQSFPNLTYGLTTAVQSDPTITVQHNAVSAGGIFNSHLIITVAIVGGVTSVAIMGAAIFVKKRRKL